MRILQDRTKDRLYSASSMLNEREDNHSSFTRKISLIILILKKKFTNIYMEGK